MTEAQGAMTDLISHIAHPPEVLASSNAQHRRLLAACAAATTAAPRGVMTEHLRGTEHVLAGLPAEGLDCTSAGAGRYGVRPLRTDRHQTFYVRRGRHGEADGSADRATSSDSPSSATSRS